MLLAFLPSTLYKYHAPSQRPSTSLAKEKGIILAWLEFGGRIRQFNSHSSPQLAMPAFVCDLPYSLPSFHLLCLPLLPTMGPVLLGPFWNTCTHSLFHDWAGMAHFFSPPSHRKESLPCVPQEGRPSCQTCTHLCMHALPAIWEWGGAGRKACLALPIAP